jgi:molybdopterin-guanine dinucleotide biosynthesis protein A
MIQKKNITAILLAGGKSSRMGADKGFVDLNGAPFISHIIETVKPLVANIMIVSNGQEYDVFKLKRVGDIIPDAGPLAGLFSGLFYSETNYNLVLSCDIPLINTAVLNLLIEGVDPEMDVTQIESGGKTMPLIAIYKKQCMHPCLDHLKQGERRLRTAVASLKTKTITLDAALDPFVRNINTQVELKALRNEFEH